MSKEIRAYTTLHGLSKTELVRQVQILERNNKALSDTIDQQYHNAMKIFEEMNIFNVQYKNSKQLRKETAILRDK